MSTELLFIADHTLFHVRKVSGEWLLKSSHVGYDVRCLVADPHQPGRLYAGTFDHGLLFSNDFGESWQAVGEGITHSRVLSVAVSDTEVVNGYGVVWAGTEPSDLFRSDDGGKTWTTTDGLESLPSRPTWQFPPRPDTHHVRYIQPDLHDPNRIFVGIELGGVMRSVDGGKTFEDRKPNSQYDCHTLTMNKKAKDRIYEAAGGGFAESRDGGVTWETYNDGLGDYTYLVDIATDPADPNIIITSASTSARKAYNHDTAKTVLMRKENDSPWEMIHAGLPDENGMTITALATTPKEAGTFYAANNKGVFRSTDKGQTWETLIKNWPDNLSYLRVHALIALPKTT